MKPKLDSEAIYKLKDAHGLTWTEIAERIGAKSRQQVYEAVKNESPLMIVPLSNLFGVGKIKLTVWK